jgi:hypothetical protein
MLIIATAFQTDELFGQNLLDREAYQPGCAPKDLNEHQNLR